jgi:CRISPR-associated protein Cas1
LELTKRILKGKATNQLNLLKYYRRSRKSESNAFAAAVENAIGKTRQILTDMQSIEFNIPYSVTRDRLFSGEARISVYYWGGMKLLIQPELGFEKRVRFKAGDLVNNMLNYGYGILYQRVWQSIQKQGLNPHISFLHAFQAGKPTLVYDMVEEFRQPFVDRAVFSLLTKGKKGADLNIDPKTGLLNKKTRDLVVKAVLERLSSLINYRGEKKKCETIIELQMKNLVLFLKGEKIYKPFISGY